MLPASSAHGGSLSPAATPEQAMAIPFTRILIAVWVRRRRIVLSGVCGACAGGALALCLPDQYTSSASLMPPDAASLNQPSAINMTGTAPISLGASLASQRTPGATVIGILSSRSAEDALIQRYDLLQHYGTPSLDAARKELLDNSNFDEDKKSGIVTIKVTDRDRVHARDLAQAYVDEVNILLNTLSTSAAGKEHTFLEARLAAVKAQLDKSSADLSAFSSKHETLNPTGQGAALIQTQALMKEQLVTAQSELAGLQAVYSDRNVRVQTARARVATLQGQLHQMSVSPSAEGEPAAAGSPSLRQLPLLAVTYADLSRQVAAQQAVYETLTKQAEISRVQEAKDTPVAKQLDTPVAAEKHSSPHRLLICLAGCVLGALGAGAWFAFVSWWRLLNGQYGLSAYLADLLKREQDVRGGASVATDLPA